MRLRERRRIEKRARIAAHTRPFRWKQLAGVGPEELLQIALNPGAGWNLRAEAAKNSLRKGDSPGTPAFAL